VTWRPFSIAASLLLALSCAREATPTSTGTGDTMSQNERSIVEGGQATFGDLHIGTGNFWEEGGQLTCQLSLSGPFRNERVKPGQVLEQAGKKIEVLRIERGPNGKGQVTVKVTP
jgi:hypothetical protein